MGVVSELRTPKFFARHGECARWLFGDDEFSNQRWQLFDTVQHVVGCFLIFAGIHKSTIGDRSEHCAAAGDYGGTGESEHRDQSS